MKKITVSIILASLLPFSMAMAGTPDVKKEAGFDRAEMRANHEAKFAQELGLTDAQKAKLAELKAKGQANREAEKAEFESVLTPEQKAKFATMKQKRHEMKSHKKVEHPPVEQPAHKAPLDETVKTQ